jgi:hypothetical protein
MSTESEGVLHMRIPYSRRYELTIQRGLVLLITFDTKIRQHLPVVTTITQLVSGGIDHYK